MENIVFMSIKEQHIKRILEKTKNHEFRNRISKEKVDYIFVYVPTPIKELKYILKVKEIVGFPNQIEVDGYGNEKFNAGKGSKYAYPIENMYEINNPIELKELKGKFNFTAPQSFAYGKKYKELLTYIDKNGIKKIY